MAGAPLMQAEFTWKKSPSATIGAGLEDLQRRLKQAFQAVGHIMASQIESAAKAGAVWIDRTGDARRRLTAVAVSTGYNLTITLFHQMSYGLWLEVKRSFGGRYAIILKTIATFFPRVMAMLQRLIFGG